MEEGEGTPSDLGRGMWHRSGHDVLCETGGGGRSRYGQIGAHVGLCERNNRTGNDLDTRAAGASGMEEYGRLLSDRLSVLRVHARLFIVFQRVLLQ